MPHWILSKNLVLLLFIGVTLGQGLPFGELYQLKSAREFSCHCCEHKRGDCAHCAKFGHGHNKTVAKKQSDKKSLAYQAKPCRSAAQEVSGVHFSWDPFLLETSGPYWEQRIIYFRQRPVLLSSSPGRAPPTPPPIA